jgi:hypothetical protein
MDGSVSVEKMFRAAVVLTPRMRRRHRRARIWRRAAAELYREARRAGATMYKNPPLPSPACVVDAWIAFYRAAPYRCVLQYDVQRGESVGCAAVLFETEGY